VPELLWAKPLIQGPKCHSFFVSEFFHSLLGFTIVKNRIKWSEKTKTKFNARLEII